MLYRVVHLEKGGWWKTHVILHSKLSSSIINNETTTMINERSTMNEQR
jgi:hypothetical protein